MDMQIKERVNSIFVEHLGVTPEEIMPTTLLVPEHDDKARRLQTGRADLNCDSLDIIELVMAFEEEFGIEISDDETNELNVGTVQNVYDLIAGKVSAVTG